MSSRFPSASDVHSEQHLFADFRPPVVYAEFGERLAAFILDIIIAFFGLGLAVSFLEPILEEAMGLINLCALWLYFALQESGPRQATLGKRALGIIVTDLQGNRVSFGQATGRFFARIFSHMLLLIGYLMVLWDQQRQSLHDKVANCLVVKGRIDSN